MQVCHPCGEYAKIPPLKRGAPKLPPVIDNSIFKTVKYLQAICNVSDEEAPPNYLNMGVVSGLALGAVRKKPELLR
jgi:hypothetical protein